MLTVVVRFKSIWKVYWIDISGFISVPKCSSFQGSFWVKYLTSRLWVPSLLSGSMHGRFCQLIRSKTKTNYD